MKAAKMATETGNANYVQIWVPEESENTQKNILEKTCWVPSVLKNMQDCDIDWYFEIVNRIYSANKRELYTCLKPGGFDMSPMFRRWRE